MVKHVFKKDSLPHMDTKQDRLELILSRLEPLIRNNIHEPTMEKAYDCFIQIGKDNPKELKLYIQKLYPPEIRPILIKYYRLICQML